MQAMLQFILWKRNLQFLVDNFSQFNWGIDKFLFKIISYFQSEYLSNILHLHIYIYMYNLLWSYKSKSDSKSF